jgi:hypothetical protein
MTANRPFSIRLALVFTLLNSLVWLAFGVIIAAGGHPALPNIPLLKAVMVFGAFGAAAVLVGLFIFLRKGSRAAYVLALVFFAVSSILIFFDQVGVTDLVVLALNLVPVAFLIKGRSWFTARHA